MADLLTWLANSDLHPLISSCVFHYEFEFIHPFADGNGRMGRLWQTLILNQWNPLLAQLPVESMVHARQSEYYQVINQSTQKMIQRRLLSLCSRRFCKLFRMTTAPPSK